MNRLAKLSLLVTAAGLFAFSTSSHDANAALEDQRYTYETFTNPDEDDVYTGCGYFHPDGRFLLTISENGGQVYSPVPAGDIGIQPGTWKEFRFRRFRFFNAVFDIKYSETNIDVIDSYGAVPRDLSRPINGQTRQNDRFLLRWTANNVTAPENCDQCNLVHDDVPTCEE